MKITFLAFTLALGFPLLADEEKKRNDIIPVESDDTEMKAAMALARKKFVTNFLTPIKRDKRLDTPKIDQAMAKVYFANKDDPDGGEHMWVDQISQKGEQFTGTLQSKPGTVKSLNLGDKVTFKLDRLSDWLIVKDGRAFGAYTVQVLRQRMTADEREKHDSHYPFTFSPLPKKADKSEKKKKSQ